MRRARPPHPRHGPPATPRSRRDQAGAWPEHPNTPRHASRGSYPGGSRKGRACPSLPRLWRPGHDARQARQSRPSARFTDFPCEGRRARGTRIRSGGASEASDDARTEWPSCTPTLVRQTPAKCPACARPISPSCARPISPAHKHQSAGTEQTASGSRTGIEHVSPSHSSTPRHPRNRSPRSPQASPSAASATQVDGPPEVRFSHDA